MAVIQDIYNGDEYYQALLDKGKFMLDCNDLDLALTTEKEEFVRKVSTTYYNLEDAIDNIPRCSCGNLKGVYAANCLCKNCCTIATRPLDEAYPTLWARVDDPDFKFLNPNYYALLVQQLSTMSPYKQYKYEFDPIRWLVDTTYNPLTTSIVISVDTDDPEALSYKTTERKKKLEAIAALTKLIMALTGCEEKEVRKYRSYPFIMSNLRKILDIVKDTSIMIKAGGSKESKERRVSEVERLIAIYDNNKDKLFSHRVPIIIDNKELVEERSIGGKEKCYVNMALGDLKNIIFKWNRVCKQLSLLTDNNKIKKVINTQVANYLHKYTEYMYGYASNNIARKTGLIRRHIYGCKSHYTFRCVIASVAGPHQPDELVVPWAVGLITYRAQVMNILLNRYKFTYAKASKLISSALLRYDPIISEVYDILLREAPTGRLPLILQRNPSLKRGSAIKVWIKDFKRDNVSDYTLNVSPKIIKLPNGDFDGFDRSGKKDNTVVTAP